MTFWMNRADLFSSEIGWEFQGQEHDASISFLIIIAPAGVPHKFVNSGPGLIRQVDIHPSPRMITIWLEE